MNPTLQAWQDMRDEGIFRPNQYPAGSNERIEYELAQLAIEQREAESDERSNVNIGQPWNREDEFAAEYGPGQHTVDPSDQKAASI